VDVFMVERGGTGDPKDDFLKKYFPLMGYRHSEHHNNQDDIYVRNDFQM
jgi:hypothetical protein